MKWIILIVLLIFAVGCSDDYLYGPDETALIDITLNNRFYIFLLISNDADNNHIHIVETKNNWNCDNQFIIGMMPDYKSINIRAYKLVDFSGTLTIKLIDGNSATALPGIREAEIDHIRDN